VLPVLEQGRYRQMVTGTDRHGHGPASGVSGSDARWLSAALVLILAFMAGEIVAGLTAHSLALISDAAHMLTDAASIALVLVTARLAARPPAGGYTYGLRRTEIMSAQANGITLVLLAAWLGYSAIRRLVAPPRAAPHGTHQTRNPPGAFKHIPPALSASAATAVAGLIIVLTGFTRADAIA